MAEEIIPNPVLLGNNIDLNSLSTYEKVKKACEYILSSENKSSPVDSLSSSDLFIKVKEEFEGIFDKYPKNTFYQYLSNTVRDDKSAINCLGRKKGYYLSSVAISDLQKAESEETYNNLAQTQSRVFKEELLYPFLESWLVAQGYQAQNISSGRALGKWGNPDVAGIAALDAFSGLSIELVTIEAKTSLDNWEQWIFEAISHRRFANRSYFAFAHPEETISKIPQDMRYYSELYGIGVLVLSMENDKYDKLQKGDVDGFKGEDFVEVNEVFTAPYNIVQPKYQLKFCNAVGISCPKELYRWGRAQE